MPTPHPPSRDTPTRGPARPGPYILSGILIAIAIVLPLVPPIYARMDPQLAGIPFFYWYQMLWVFISAGLLWICYGVMTREDRRRREVARRMHAAPDAGAAGEGAGE